MQVNPRSNIGHETKAGHSPERNQDDHYVLKHLDSPKGIIFYFQNDYCQ